MVISRLVRAQPVNQGNSKKVSGYKNFFCE